MENNSSELILNDDGSIYHLGLRPEDIADKIITVGDPDRAKLVASRFDEIRFEKHRREFHTITGRIGKIEVTVISTGIGTDNIDIVFNELDALVNVDLESRIVHEKLRGLKFIRLGTSGAIRSEVEIDSFIVSAYAIGMDVLLQYYPLQSDHAALDKLTSGQGNYAASADVKLLKRFSQMCRPGITVTAPGFYAPQSRMLRLKPRINILEKMAEIEYAGLKVTNLEMETAGIYGLSRLLGHQAISINAILANRVTKDFSTEPQKTVERMIDESIPIIEAL